MRSNFGMNLSPMDPRWTSMARWTGAFALVCAASAAHAQFNASLNGTVQDPTQAAIPNATITLINNGTQAKQTVTSGADGAFAFSELAPGDYTVQVTAAGFAKNTTSNVTVAAESPRSLTVTMQTGAETQTVNVNADTVPVLQTTDPSIGRTIDGEEVTRLPVFGADPYELLRTAP